MKARKGPLLALTSALMAATSAIPIQLKILNHPRRASIRCIDRMSHKLQYRKPRVICSAQPLLH